MTDLKKIKTPRTDEYIKQQHQLDRVDDFNHYFKMTSALSKYSRQLERELIAAYEERDRYKAAEDSLIYLRVREVRLLREQEQRVGELERLVYVPGMMKCAKCGFVLVTNVLNATTGDMGSDNTPKECANGCGPMWRLTERDAGNEMVDRAVAAQERAEQAEADLAQMTAKYAVLTVELEAAIGELYLLYGFR